MKKRGLLKWIMLLPVAAFVLTGCPGDEPEDMSWPELPPSIGVQGGTVEGLDGDVVLTIPPGALAGEFRFVINDMPLKSGSNGCELLRTFIIEPPVTFKVPAKLKVYVNGCLSNGKTICEEAEVSFQIWGNFTEYCNDEGKCCSVCTYEKWSQSISACIGRTGVISTVGQAL